MRTKRSYIAIYALLTIISLPICAQHRPNPGEMLVSELLFNPVPNGADYVELYNASDSTISLDSMVLVKVNSDGTTGKHYPLPSHQLPAHDYVVLTTDRDFVLGNYTVAFPQKLLEINSMPSYNDDKGCVLLARKDSVVLDSFAYNEKMHSRLIADPEGVALERRSYAQPTNSPTNWYSAASTTAPQQATIQAGYGTPTGVNSQSREILFTENDFHLEPSIFSPDGDGYYDLLDITYQLVDDNLSANVTIFDAAGHTVRHLLLGALLGSSGHLTWDGLDDYGKLSARGNYLLIIDAYNTHGDRQRLTRNFTLIIR